jgi:hypothetical protein
MLLLWMVGGLVEAHPPCSDPIPPILLHLSLNRCRPQQCYQHQPADDEPADYQKAVHIGQHIGLIMHQTAEQRHESFTGTAPTTPEIWAAIGVTSDWR